jgi:uridine kinase
MNEIQLRIVNYSGKKDKVNERLLVRPQGTTAESLVQEFGSLTGPVAAVKVNNEILSLSTQLEINASIEPVLLNGHEGTAIYRRTLAFLLAAAVRDVFPEWRLYIGHSLGRSYYYTFANDIYSEGNVPKPEDIQKLAEKMQSLAEENLPIVLRNVAYSDALDLFEKNRQDDTALLLSGRNESMVLINQCGLFMDIYTAPLLNRTGLLRSFELMPYQEGFLLRFPAAGQTAHIEPFADSPKIFEVYRDYKKWGRIVGVHAAGHLNRMISGNGIREYIYIAEAFQQKKLDEIASRIYEKRDTVKAILIAGPSSSGKTTTAKRLSLALKVMGIAPIAISLDNYYINTDRTPRDEEGKPDYECLEALDIAYLNEQLLDFLAGREVTPPVYDFRQGRRKENGGKPIRMDQRSMLVIEGIHGLNDALTPQINRNTKFKLYVSALTQLNLDDHNRIPTSDNRLLRRIVRDNRFRGTGALQTLGMWPSVHKGEKKYIFPFQNEVDAAFNSALDYELAVLKYYAEPLLHSVKPWMYEYAEAVRLLSFLKNFAPIPPQYVPGQSILREFIGDSEFKY